MSKIKGVVWLQSNCDGKLNKEENYVNSYLVNSLPKHYDIRLIGSKQVNKITLPDNFQFAVGNIGFIHTVFKKMSLPIPNADSYPDILKGFLNREIKDSTLFYLKDEDLPLFIKPKKEVKLFTGFVCDTIDDWRLKRLSKKTEIHTAKPVNVSNEVRVYYYHYDDKAACHYCANKDPNLYRLIKTIINTYIASGGPKAGSFDMGIIDGKWSLIEVNGNYSIGCYDDVPGWLYTAIVSDSFK